MQDDLSRSVVLFLGAGVAPFPGQNQARLVKEFGRIRGEQLASEVVSLLQELGKIEVDWSVHTYDSACKMTREQMHLCHPELSEEALNALEWKFSYEWR
jgi:hypothetical protein